MVTHAFITVRFGRCWYYLRQLTDPNRGGMGPK
jgi:hypothetical protein